MVVSQEISDAIEKEDLDLLQREINKGKLTIRAEAEKADPEIKNKYLPMVLGSLDTYDLLVKGDETWEERADHYFELLNRHFDYYIMAVSELVR